MLKFKDLLPTRTHDWNLHNWIQMREQMDRLFENPFSNKNLMAPLTELSPFNFSAFPSINVSETDKVVTIKAELPGLNEKDINIETYRNQLTISGERKEEKSEDKANFHIKELAYGQFSRSINLPFDIDNSNSKASFDNGILQITVKKPNDVISQTKTIPIKNNNNK